MEATIKFKDRKAMMKFIKKCLFHGNTEISQFLDVELDFCFDMAIIKHSSSAEEIETLLNEAKIKYNYVNAF